MTLTNHNTRVVDGLRDTKLEHLSLKATLQQLLYAELQNTIQVPRILVQDVEASPLTDQRTAFKNAAGILFSKRQNLTRRLADFGQNQLDAL